jgi:AcrR family transcriptional regulator
MTIQCTACKLSKSRREALESLLASGMSIHEISRRSGLSKSALSNHFRHSVEREQMREAAAKEQAAKEAAMALGNKPAGSSPSRDRILERVERLWGESIAGLEDSKAPVTINRPDGSSMKVPGDLRARAGFIRSAKDVLQLSAQLSGELSPTINADVVFVCSSIEVNTEKPSSASDDAGDDVIDIGYTREID